MAIDQQYVRRYRQHIPFYKSNFPQEDRREYWHHRRCLCDPDCIFGIPVVESQYLMFVIEDDSPTDIDMLFSGVSQNSSVYTCCLDEGDNDLCFEWDLQSVQGQTLNEHSICIIDGAPIQFNYLRIQVPDDVQCGLQYIKIVAYEGTVNERIYYSEPIFTYQTSDALQKKLVKLNIGDSCGVGGVNWSDVWGGWSQIDGYEVYLPERAAVSFAEEVTDEEVEEDGKGNEIQIFKKVDVRYQFDTTLVPDHFAEIVKELEMTDDNAVTIVDRQSSHYVEISRAVSTYLPDGDGCYMNVNMSFIINSYSKDSCCDVQICECPSDNAIQAISYTTDQDVAESGVNVGDTYLVPNNGSVITNPDWSTHDNEIAVWNGSGWDYSPNTIQSYVFVIDTGSHWISKGVGDVWEQEDAIITNIFEVGGGTCTVDVTVLSPLLTFWKLQFQVVPGGPWTDVSGVFHASEDWINSIQHSVPFMNNYNWRVIPLNTGCSLSMSPEVNMPTTETCV